jgi:hypothetical protein
MPAALFISLAISIAGKSFVYANAQAHNALNFNNRVKAIP